MIGEKMAASLMGQFKAEMYSSNLYLAMAAWFELRNLKGFAHWMRKQAQEEYAHAMKFFDYLVERGAQPTIAAIDAPPMDWGTAREVFEHVLQHEQKVTAMIDKLAAQADSERDRPTTIMLQWFITEQVEEEANANEIVAKLQMAGDSAGALLVLDHHLGKRE